MGLPDELTSQPPNEDERVPLVPDQGEDEGDLDHDPAAFTASIGSKDWTVETLVSQMRKERIDLAPSFQRRNAWLDNRKSKLIESILLGFPIPQIVLAERRDIPGHYFVLDGKQRLLALRQFFADPDNPADKGFTPLKLRSLEVFADLNRLDLGALEESRPELAARLENHTIRTVVLSEWNSEDMLLSLFLRLNTGSVPLSPQELRQALIPGRFIEWLDKTSGEVPALRELLGNTQPDRRMADAELMLRHLSFAISPLAYDGNLKRFLDQTSRVFNHQWDQRADEIEAAAEEFDRAVAATLEAFGDAACRKWSGVRFERALNRAVFDVQIYAMSIPHVRAAILGSAEEVLAGFRRACESNERFVRSISTTTKTAEAFRIRHRQWAEIVRESCGTLYDLPSPLNTD